MQAALWKWILGHPDVAESPIANDTLKVWNPEMGKKDKVVAKQLRMICVHNLHNGLLKPVSKGGFEYAYMEDVKYSLVTQCLSTDAKGDVEDDRKV